jgi:flagellar biosynthesis/type III secretory pathway M-ring protein FliF/YscJ
MKNKMFFLVPVFFAVSAFCLGQNLEDIFDMGAGNSNKKGEVTLSVDQNLAKGNPTEQEVNAKQDSIFKLYEKWKNYFTGINNEMSLQLEQIEQLDPEKVKKEELKKHRRQIDDFKEEVTNYLSNNNDISWKDNDELVEKNVLFYKNYRTASAKLEDMEEKHKKDPLKKLIPVGIAFMSLMVLLPIFMQVKAGISTKKLKKVQDKLMKKQQAELEKQKLLSNENEMIIIKE